MRASEFHFRLLATRCPAATMRIFLFPFGALPSMLHKTHWLFSNEKSKTASKNRSRKLKRAQWCGNNKGVSNSDADWRFPVSSVLREGSRKHIMNRFFAGLFALALMAQAAPGVLGAQLNELQSGRVAKASPMYSQLTRSVERSMGMR